MTRKEADFIGGMNMCDEISNEAYRKIMCHCEEQEPCEDAVSRQVVKEQMIKYGFLAPDMTVAEFVEDYLQPVNLQKPKEGYISIDDVMSVFDDFMCGEVDEDGTEIFLEMLKDKAESEE